MNESKSKTEKLSEVLADLKAEYQKKLPQKIELMKSSLKAQDWNSLREEFHKLKGTGKTYGFAEVSVLCEVIENYCLGEGKNVAVFETAFALFAKMQERWKNGEELNVRYDSQFTEMLRLMEKK